MTEKMKIGTHRLKDPGKKKKYILIRYKKISKTKVDASLDKLFGPRPKFKFHPFTGQHE